MVFEIELDLEFSVPSIDSSLLHPEDAVFCSFGNGFFKKITKYMERFFV